MPMPVVGDRDPSFSSTRFEADRNLALSGRELDRVVEQVGDHLLQANRIPVDRAERALGGDSSIIPFASAERRATSTAL